MILSNGCIAGEQRNPFEYVKKQPKKVYVKPKPRKPVVRTKSKSLPKTVLTLNGVFWGDETYVVINQKLLRQGDVVQGWRVEDISDHEVVLMNGSETKVLVVE